MKEEKPVQTPDENKQQLIQALLEKPSTYEIDILDGEMIPDQVKLDSEGKEKKFLVFVVNPPTAETLARCTVAVFKIPEEIRNSQDVQLEDALKYRNEIAEVLAILAHGKSSDFPDWHIPFFLNNVTPKDLYKIFYESILKMQTDFFLNSFQIANQNPMMMMMKKKKKKN